MKIKKLFGVVLASLTMTFVSCGGGSASTHDPNAAPEPKSMETSEVNDVISRVLQATAQMQNATSLEEAKAIEKSISSDLVSTELADLSEADRERFKEVYDEYMHVSGTKMVEFENARNTDTINGTQNQAVAPDKAK